MTRFSPTALLAALAFAAPSLAFAHEGILHDGCPTGQSFTAGGITVSGAYARATPPNAQSAGAYLSIANAGPNDDVFTGASTEAARETSLHQMKMAGDVMEMSALPDGLPVPAGGTVALDPMGYHLMLTGFSQPFVKGQCLEMILHFARAGDLKVELNIGGFAQSAPPSGSDAPAEPSHTMDMSSMAM
jgi:copper(I)-binding protein